MCYPLTMNHSNTDKPSKPCRINLSLDANTHERLRRVRESVGARSDSAAANLLVQFGLPFAEDMLLGIELPRQLNGSVRYEITSPKGAGRPKKGIRPNRPGTMPPLRDIPTDELLSWTRRPQPGDRDPMQYSEWTPEEEFDAAQNTRIFKEQQRREDGGAGPHSPAKEPELGGLDIEGRQIDSIEERKPTHVLYQADVDESPRSVPSIGEEVEHLCPHGMRLDEACEECEAGGF